MQFASLPFFPPEMCAFALIYSRAASAVSGDADSAVKDVNSYLGLHLIYTYLFMSVFD